MLLLLLSSGDDSSLVGMQSVSPPTQHRTKDVKGNMRDCEQSNQAVRLSNLIKMRIVLVRRAHAMLYEYLVHMGVWFNACQYDEEVCRACFLRFCGSQLGEDVQLDLAVATSLLLAYHKEFGSKPGNVHSLTANLFPSTGERKELTWLASRSKRRARHARPRRRHESCAVTDAIELHSDTEETDDQASDDSDGDVIATAILSARE